MNTKETTSFKDQKEKLNTFLEIASLEKQLLSSMYSKGLLHKDVRELYHKARASYENIILNAYEAVGLQEVEYSLWKLHYKHIDEYRKLMHQSNAEKRKSETSEEDKIMDRFKSFLSEATHFYQELVKKLRKSCGLPGELFLRKKGETSEPVKFPPCQYACHRFLVCLGDLARYGELCKNRDSGKWSTSATYYLEALWTWPDSGNPHNQLALLATYTGDAFLALYHCVRSLAVKEPFPDAWNNLMLLFEENRSSHFHSLSSEARLDLLNPSEKTLLVRRSDGSSSDDKLEGMESASSGKSDIWPLFVRLISFFLLKSSLEDFSHTFASAVRQLEALMALGDEELKAALESYRFMDPSRKGPYRTLQLVAVFIFIIHCLTEKDEEEPESDLAKLALTATFVCTGRIIERCSNGGGVVEECPLLPTVLMFVEWLGDTLERVEAHASDERVMSAMSYFFGSLADLLNRLVSLSNEDGVASDDGIALWEDHELKGFDLAHTRLDFARHWECMESFLIRKSSRTQRIFRVAAKHAGVTGVLRNWIVYDNSGKRFNTVVSKESQEQSGERQNDSCFDSQSSTTEEEEVILFNPITRHNSAPAYTSRQPSSDRVSAEGTKEGAATSDECLRRASSLFAGQNQTQVDTFSFRPGPPSFKAWVIDNEIPDRESFDVLSIDETKDPVLCSSPVSAAPPPYVSPLPSAPLLPEDASWFKGNKEGDGILGAAPMSGGYTTRGPFDYVRGGAPSFLEGFSPMQGMSSSEWLYHYRNRQGFDRVNNHFNAPISYYGNLNVARYDLLDQRGNPLASSPSALYLESPQLIPGPLVSGNKFLFGFQRPSPYGTGMETRSEPPKLLHYLKERELQLQQESQFRGPNFMGN